MRWHWAAIAALLFGSAGSGQVRYATGQNIAPEFEGWEHNPDGTYSMVFGYLNRNYEEELDIPVGPNNTVSPGGDRGQPEHFYPRRQRFLFKVVVPADWDKTQKVVWTLTSHGRTDQAKGWLQPEWELSEDVMIENMGGGVPDPGNKPPTLTTGADQMINLPNTATLTGFRNPTGARRRTRIATRSPSAREAFRSNGFNTGVRVESPSIRLPARCCTDNR